MQGNVRIFVWNTTSWSQRGSDIVGDYISYHCGWSVALSSNGLIVAIGEPGSSNGHVRIAYME